MTLGGTIVERHVTLSRRMYGPDAALSLEPEDLARLVREIRELERMLASPVDKDALEGLAGMKEIFEKSVVARVDIAAGTELEPSMLTVKKPGTGIPARLSGRARRRPCACRHLRRHRPQRGRRRVGAVTVRPPRRGSESVASVTSPSRAARAMQFSDYIPVDVERLRPAGSYRQMVESRGERMALYVDATGTLRPELVEAVPCPLCGADEPRPLFEKEGFTFVQCGACDFIYVNPQLREDAVRDFYEDEDHSTLIEQLVASSNDYRKERFGKERLDIVESFAKRSPGRLLDVGCTTGFFLEAAAERGWDAHGMELNPYAAQVALAKGLQVRQEMIEEADYEPESFDAVTIFDVVEHVRKPVEMLEKIASLLRPGGVVLLYTPNWDCCRAAAPGRGLPLHLGDQPPRLLHAEDARGSARARRVRGRVARDARLDFEDAFWYFEEHGAYDMEFVKRFRHELQFLADAAGHGKNLRMVGRRP